MRSIVLAVLLTTILGGQTLSTQGPKDNAELSQMFKADQSEREGANVDWTGLYYHDADRRKRLHAMLSEGGVKTATDYFHAAMIYQHGQNPDDYLLAHVLAVAAISKGCKDARWLAAATMDRYLRSIWQPQIYGTQFDRSSDHEPWSHQPMNETLVSDSIRAAQCVEALAKQKDDLAKTSSKSMPGGTEIDACE
jgi:hypothetical protein